MGRVTHGVLLLLFLSVSGPAVADERTTEICKKAVQIPRPFLEFSTRLLGVWGARLLRDGEADHSETLQLIEEMRAAQDETMDRLEEVARLCRER